MRELRVKTVKRKCWWRECVKVAYYMKKLQVGK